MHTSIPHSLLVRLKEIEPQTEFTGSLPRVQSSSGNLYFAKIGSLSDVEQYTGEAESLKAIEAAAPGLAPRVLSFERDDANRPTFISEYKELDRLTDSSAKVLARRLATELHAYESPNGYGFHVPTFCGATKLKNGWYESWEACFGAMISDLLDQLRRSVPYRVLCGKGDKVVQE
jgi:protein-ribulosamine 3-kinase